MSYSPLVTIKLNHSFYDRGGCPDFSIIPDAQTARLLRNHRCVVRANAYGLVVYVPTENQQPLVRFAGNSQLRFDLEPRSGDFALYTGQRFELSKTPGLQLLQAGVPVSPKNGMADTPDLRNVRLSITIQRDFNQLKAVPSLDEVSFFAKPILWFYYLVTDQSNSDQFAIVDVRQSNPKTAWQLRKPTPDDSVYSQLAQQYPAMTIVCFVSKQALDCHEAGNKHLQLRLGDHTIFEQLPSPSHRNYFQITTKTKKGSNTTSAIYEIVKYLTNTTLIKG